MATRTWLGGTSTWTNAAAWSGDVVPSLADSEIVAAGTAEFTAGETLEAATIDLGSTTASAPAELVLVGSLLGYQTTIDSDTAGAQALLVALGAAAFNGTIDANASGGSFNLAAYASGGTAGDLTLLGDGAIVDSGGDSMLLVGTLTNHSTVTIGNGGDFVNDGTVAQSSAAFEVESGGTLAGTGLFEIGLYSSLYFQQGAAASSENVRFTDVGGRLLLADPATFTGTIANFATGDLIDLTATQATGATYNVATGLLSVTDNGAVVATLTLAAPAGTGFVTESDGATGTLIELSGTQTRVDYTIDAADRAMGANVVRATMTTESGAAITGAGVRIGIISDSFDEQPGYGAADVANAAAEAGYLPETASGTSAVTVLTDAYGSGDDNEGLAMAELVHQAAPGASIDFATGDGGLATFASAVTALQDAGCNVIVDDLGYDTEPFFQDAGPLDTAIDSAVAAGVTYVTSAGNDGGQAAYQAAFAPSSRILYDGTAAQAQLFANGTPYQTVTLAGGVTASFDLQWATPFSASADGSALQAVLFDGSGNVVATSRSYASLGDSGASAAGAELSYTPQASGTYQLAIYGSLPAGTMFKYILLGSLGGGTDVAGTIDDPTADAGTIKGHAMLPDVLTVGAVDFPETPDSGTTDGYATYYSSTGDAEFLYNANGSAIADPTEATKPDILAPVSAATSVSGFAPFAGTSAAAPEAAAVAALMLQANPSLTPADIKADLEASADSIGQPGSIQGAGAINAVGAVDLALGYTISCFGQGTRIATPHGPVPVEDLSVGGAVLTESGQARPVVWLGHRRVDCARHPRPHDVRPIRVQAHAFAPGCPFRDLLLSPDHAIKFGGALIPVRYLVNGASIAQIEAPSVVYWHVELPSHDVLLAENLPAESFLDTGNRAAFAGDVVDLHPDFARNIWAAQGCAPLLTEGPAVAGAHAHLLARAQRLGHTLDTDADLRVLPSSTGMVRLLSRTWVPAHFGEPDHRCLGIAVANLRRDGVPIPLDDPRLASGWHGPERDWRWTDGAATFVANNVGRITFDLALPGRYWVPATVNVRPSPLRLPTH